MLLLFVIIVVANANYCDPPKLDLIKLNNYTLKHVSTIIRHGDRASVMDIGKYLQCENGQCVSTQLTNKGIEQHKQLGIFMREYLDSYQFFDNPNNATIQIRSTNTQRTISSTNAFISTFVNNSFINYNGVEIRTKNDSLCYKHFECPLINKLISEQDDLLFLHDYNESMQNVSKKFERITQLGVEERNKLVFYADYTNCLRCHNLSFPCYNGECLDRNDHEKMNSFVVEWFKKHSSHPYLAKLEGSPMFKELLINIENSLNCNNANCSKYHHYTGHDYTLYPLLTLLGQNITEWIPYASYMIFEVFEKEELFIRISFNSKPIKFSKCEQNNDGLYSWRCFKAEIQKEFTDYIDCFN
ncbi:Lysophosphatidic acid phosphatase type 6 [Entamoeba marina]